MRLLHSVHSYLIKVSKCVKYDSKMSSEKEAKICKGNGSLDRHCVDKYLITLRVLCAPGKIQTLSCVWYTLPLIKVNPYKYICIPRGFPIKR